MLEIEEIKAKLADANIKKVAKSAGISAGSVYQLMNKNNPQPLYKTVKALSDYLENKMEIKKQ